MPRVPNQAEPFVCYLAGKVSNLVEADVQWIGEEPAVLNQADFARLSLICLEQLLDRTRKEFEQAGGEAACLSDTSRYTQVTVSAQMHIRINPKGVSHVVSVESI